MELINASAARPTSSLCLLGASGSVGSTTLRFLRSHPETTPGAFSVHRSADHLRSLLVEFHSSVRFAAISDEVVFENEKDRLQSEFPSVFFFGGPDGVVEMVRETECDTVLTAVVGSAGIEATVAAIRAGKKIALANKETLVTAGPAILSEAQSARGRGLPVCFLPVDSEHNAAFQLLEGMDPRRLQTLILTASGGPFRDRSAEDVKRAGREEVLHHPTWKMGPKITVDSAGMINKGLEIIEARFLFDLPYNRLDVRIHRNSYVHAMVRTTDGGMLMAASPPDMIFPVAHSLCYPDPVKNEQTTDDCTDWPPLTFEALEPGKYPGYFLCLQAGQRGGTAPAILNAANEVSVDLFLKGVISFYQIPEVIEYALSSIEVKDGTDLALFQEADHLTRLFLGDRYGIRKRELSQ